MTALNTAIFVQGKQDPVEIYNTALQQILFYDGRDAAPEDISFYIHTEPDGREVIYASPHENLPVRLAVYHRSGGDMYTKEEVKTQWETICDDQDCPSHRPRRAQPVHLVVALSTNLYWTDEKREGWNAGNLHGGMVWSIGGLLDARKVSWWWQENTCHEIHEGYDSLHGLPVAVNNARLGLSGSTGFSQIAQMLSQEILKRMGFASDEE